MKKNLALYFHYPFCLRKCFYCDFASMVGSDDEKTLAAYNYSIQQNQSIIENRQITSMFFGGGTPSLMTEKLLENIFKQFDLSECKEITIEVNPATIDEAKFKFFKDIGINRVSIGVQSLIDDDLTVMGRLHTSKEALQTIDIAKKYFDNVSADFIYGRPNQTVTAWEQELDKILSLDLPHLSIYQLTIENNWQVEVPDDEITSQMFLLNHAKTSEKMEHYEISNYAKDGFQSVHNLAYWNYQDYLGIGPSAHSRIEGKAISYDSNIKEWLIKPKSTTEILSPSMIVVEKFIMGLRLANGIELTQDDYDNINKTQLDFFIKEGYLVLENNNLSPTFLGLQFNNYIIQNLLY